MNTLILKTSQNTPLPPKAQEPSALIDRLPPMKSASISDKNPSPVNIGLSRQTTSGKGAVRAKNNSLENPAK